MATQGEKMEFYRLRTALVCLLCGCLLAGCTPKRVINDEIITGKETDSRAPAREKPEAEAPARPEPARPAPTEDFGSRAAALARKQLGKMYQWGGSGPDRFDCSGLVYFVYGNLGVSMPRVSEQQALMGREIPRKELQPGDLVYFATSGSDINHVGIFLGRSKFVHAPRKGMPVRTDTLNNGWWRQKYRGARRLKD